MFSKKRGIMLAENKSLTEFNLRYTNANHSFGADDFTSDLYSFACGHLFYTFCLHNLCTLNIYIVLILNFFLCLLTLLLNVLVMYIIAKHKEFKCAAFSLYFYTACTDLFLAFAGMPLWIIVVMMALYRTHSCGLFEVTIFILHVMGMVSFSLVFLLAMDRYIAIFKPFYYNAKIQSKRHVYGLITAIIVVTMFIVTLATFLLKNYNLLNFIQLAIIFSNFIIQLLIYSSICCKTKAIKRTYAKRIGKRFKNKNCSQDRKLVFSNMLLVITLYLCYLPQGLKLILEFTNMLEGHWIFTIGLWTYFFIGLKSLLNPILYCFSLKSVRVKISELFVSIRLVKQKDSKQRNSDTQASTWPDVVCK